MPQHHEQLTGRFLAAPGLAAVLKESIAKPSSVRPEVPAKLDEIVMRALERHPDADIDLLKQLRGSDFEAVLSVVDSSSSIHASMVLAGIYSILAIELYNAAQSMEFRRPAKSSPYLESFLSDYRKVVSFVDKDTLMYVDINKTIDFLERGKYYL